MAGLFDDLPNVSAKRPAAYGLGNIDLANRPVVRNPDGSISTVRSMSVNFDGEEVLIPTVSGDGRVLSDDDAIQEYRRTGQFLGKFKTPDEATAYAESLHNDQEQQYSAPRQPVASLFDDLPDVATTPETTMGEFALGSGLQLGRGIMRASRDTLALGVRASNAIPDLVLGPLGMARGDQMVNEIGDAFEPGISGAAALMPAAYQSELDSKIIGRDTAGDLTLGAPTGEQIVGTLLESLPAIPGLLAGGQGIAGAGGKLANALGFGLSNSAAVSQGQYFDTRKEALDEGLAPAEAQRRAENAQAGTAALSGVTGGLGGVLARALGGNASSFIGALGKGFVADAPLEGVEEGGQNIIADLAMGRDPNLTEAANAGALGAVAGGLPGAAIAGAEFATKPRATPAAPLFDDLPDAPMPGPAPEDVSDLEAMVAAITPTPSPPAPQAPLPDARIPTGPAQAATLPEDAPVKSAAFVEVPKYEGMTNDESNRDYLRSLGYTPDLIGSMTPEQISTALAKKGRKPLPADPLAASPEVPIMVTRPMREALLAQGMTRSEIAKLTPAEAQARLAPRETSAPAQPDAAPPLSIDPDARASAAFERDAAELAAELSLPPEQIDAVRARMRKPLPRDRVTGLYRPEELDATITAAQESGQPAVYVETDLTNLGGLNAKLGASGADPYLKRFADTVRAELEPLGAAVGIRKGGDEISFIVQGADKPTVDAAMARARDSFAAQTQEFADLPHPKGAAPGVGLHYGTSEVLPGQKIGDILRNADTQVELRKKGEPYEQRIEAETLGRGSPVAGEADGGIAPAAAGDAAAIGGTGQAVPAGNAQAEVAPDTASILAYRDEIGWDQRGGKIIRDIEEDGGKGGDVVARTSWVGRPRVNGGFSSFWRDRPDPINEAQARSAFDKFERGEKLGVRDQRFIDHARRFAEADRQGGADWTDPMAPPFSRAQQPGTAAPSPMRDAVSKALGPAARDTNVLPSKASLPADVAARVGPLNDRTEGFFDPETGQSYIFEDQVETADRAVWVAFHERAGHVGLRGMLMGQEADRGKAFQAFAATIGRARQNPTIAAVADAIQKAEGYSATQATEEAIAELAAAVRTGNYGEIESRYGVKVPQAQRATVAGYVARLVQQLKAALNEAVARLRGTEAQREPFSDEDVYALIEGAWRYVKDGAASVPQRGAPAVSKSPQSRAYEKAPDSLMGFRREGPQKEYREQGYKFFQPVRVTFEDGESMVDGIMGLNKPHALERARRNWPGAEIEPATRAEYDADPMNRRAESRMTREEFIGNPKITSSANAADLKPRAYSSLADVAAEPFQVGDGLTAKYSPDGAAVFDGDRVVASYNSGETLVVDRAYRRQGIGTELVYQWRSRYPAPAKARERTRASQKIQESVWARMERERAAPPEDSSADQTQTPLESRRTRTQAEIEADQRRGIAAGVLPVARGTPGWNYDESVWEGRKGARKRARAVLQDKMTAWADVQSQLAEQLGRDLPDVQNVYQVENLMHGRVSNAIDAMERTQVEPLVKAMRDAKVKTETLEEYLYARHAKERNAQIASINDAMQDGGSGMTNAEADKILAAADRSALEPLAKRVDAMTRANRKRLLDAGLITQEAFDTMDAQYKHYVPLRGKATKETDFQNAGGSAGRGVDTRRSPVQQALGRGAGNRAQNILGEVIGDAQRGIILAEKARVGRAVMRIVLANPNPALWQVEPVQTERKVDANGEVYEAVVQDWSDPSIVAVKLKGQTYKVQINNQPLAQALNNVGIDQLNAVTRAAGKINRYFSAVLTQYNPAFVPVNASRDALFGLTGLAVEHGELAALDAALNYPKAAIASFRSATNRLGTGVWDTWAREFAEAGGKTGYVSMPSVEDLQAKIGKGRLTGYSPTGLAGATRVVGDAVAAVNDSVENALRLSAYVTLRKRGMSVDKAAIYAKNLTVNFNRKGSSGSALNAWFLFYNAATQGAVRTGTLLRKPKVYAYLGALAGIQVAGTMAMLGMEDDDGESMWNKVPDHVKRRNIVLPLGGEHILTIPMPYGFNLFTYMAGRTAAAVVSDEDRPENRAGKLTADILSAATESFMPVPIGDGAMGFLPTVLRIPTNIQTNRNDFGRQIRQENPYGKFDVPRASIGRPDTLELFKLTATGLNRVGGGDEYTPPPMSWFDHAPEDIEYLLGEVTGGAGKFVIDVATLGEKAAGDAPVTMRDVPIVSRFATKVNEQAAQQSLYYERSDALNRSLERLRDTFERDGEAKAEAMLRASPELSGVAFRRRKNKGQNGQAPGSIIVSDGRPQVVAVPGSMFDAYKDAEKAVRARNEAMRDAYGKTPASLIPTAETRARDKQMLAESKKREEAQRKFNAAWLRDVVGAAE
jgi:GGDEF domain-containing protein